MTHSDIAGVGENIPAGRVGKPSSPEHLALRKEIIDIFNAHKDDTVRWPIACIEPIIEACRISFAKEIGQRLAMKFLGDDDA